MFYLYVLVLLKDYLALNGINVKKQLATFHDFQKSTTHWVDIPHLQRFRLPCRKLILQFVNILQKRKIRNQLYFLGVN